MEKNKKRKIIIQSTLLLLFIVLFTGAAIKLTPVITQFASDPGRLKEQLSSYGPAGILIFIGIQALQVIIAAIPGEVTQIAGGYIYGTLMGTLYSITGIFIGSVVVFTLSRLLGFSLVNLFMSKTQLGKFSFLFNNPKYELVLFLLFLLPGMPKDFLSYFAGLTPIKPLNFFVISSTARIPALLASTYIGANLQTGNLTAVILISVIAVLLFLAGLLMKDRIIAFLHRTFSKAKIAVQSESEDTK